MTENVKASVPNKFLSLCCSHPVLFWSLASSMFSCLDSHLCGLPALMFSTCGSLCPSTSWIKTVSPPFCARLSCCWMSVLHFPLETLPMLDLKFVLNLWFWLILFCLCSFWSLDRIKGLWITWILTLTVWSSLWALSLMVQSDYGNRDWEFQPTLIPPNLLFLPRPRLNLNLLIPSPWDSPALSGPQVNPESVDHSWPKAKLHFEFKAKAAFSDRAKISLLPDRPRNKTWPSLSWVDALLYSMLPLFLVTFQQIFYFNNSAQSPHILPIQWHSILDYTLYANLLKAASTPSQPWKDRWW